MSNPAKEKRIKWFLSLVKEKLWLEEMAEQGYILDNLTLGCIFTFRKEDPIKLLYEIDRFNLPKNPTLKEIQYKEEFLNMANEMGWHVITHDEDLNYYFCKEYREEDINELYNDEESRIFHARKFKEHYNWGANQLNGLVLLFVCFTTILQVLNVVSHIDVAGAFVWFNLIYTILFLWLAWLMRKLGDASYKELLLTREEWTYLYNSKQIRKVRKLVLTNRNLNHFLRKQAKNGWKLVHMTPTKYTFERTTDEEYCYTIDTKFLTNKRRKANGNSIITDYKDWNGINNDWQIQSLKDANEKGWEYVCAFENRSVIYRKDREDEKNLLNPKKYDNSLRFISIVGFTWFVIIISGIVGFLAGLIMGYLNFG